jgi:short-subunit dehydrogenase
MGQIPTVQNMLYSPHWKPNSVVLITGASSGLGKELALKYAKKGAQLMLTGRNEKALEEVTERCLQHGCKCAWRRADAVKDEENQMVVQETIKLYGRIDILILNAGVNAHMMLADMKDISMARQVMDINFFGYVSIAKAALDSVRQNKGQIVVVNSLSGLIGLPFRSHYSASKFAIRGFFESLANEEPDINVVNVYPQQMLGTEMRKRALVAVDTETEKYDWKYIPVDEMAEIIV